MTTTSTSQPRLAERLGYRPNDRLLIINCDDLGSSHSANLAIDRCMAYGIATSASLMVPCPSAREAAEMLKGRPIGVHLTLTCEYRTYRWRGLTSGSSLYDEDGCLASTTEIAVQRIDTADAHEECRAQIEAALSWDVDVTHLDAHMDVVQSRSDLYDVYLQLAQEYRLPVRMFSRERMEKQGFDARGRAESRGVLFNEYSIYPWPRRTRDVFFEMVPTLPPGVSEIFAHPVLGGEELNAYDPKYAHVRSHDFDCLTDPAVSELLDRHHIKRISYRTLRDIQRSL